MNFRGSAFRTVLATLFTVPFFVLFLSPGMSTASPPDTDSPTGVSSPSSFGLDYDSRLASDGEQIWLATTGKGARRGMRAQVQTLRNGKWAPVSGRVKVGGDYSLQLVAWKAPGKSRSTPCLGDTSRKGGSVRCLQDGSWKTKKLTGDLKGMNLSGLRAEGSELIGLFVKWDRKPIVSNIRVGILKDNRFVPYGGPLRYEAQQVQASLGQETADSTGSGIDVGLQLVSGDDAGVRTAAHLDDQGWTFSELPSGLASGPQLSGPVRTDSDLFFPVSEAELKGDQAGNAWPMSVYRFRDEAWARVGNRSASNGKGNAQGGIFAVGADTWVTWSQSGGQAGNNVARFKQFASKVRPNGKGFEKRIVLSSGRQTGPGLNQVVGYKDQPVFLYMRMIDGKTRATVDFTRGGGTASVSRAQ